VFLLLLSSQSLLLWPSIVVATSLSSSSSSSTRTSSIQQCLLSDELLKHHPDSVTEIPGYNAPVPTPWFSGYLTYEFYNRTVHTHYTFVLAENNEEATKPIIYWSSTYYIIYLFTTSS
jgi:hypothetical protein